MNWLKEGKKRLAEPKSGEVRKKINKFFKYKAGRGVDEETDMYDHTAKMAKKLDSDEEDFDEVEVGQKRLRPEVELDELVYGGRKVSRRELEARSDEDSEELEEEEGESEEELDEAGSEESDESEPAGVFDNLVKT